MNITILRLRYTQFLVIGLLGISLYIMAQSLSGGLSKFATIHFFGRNLLVANFTELRMRIGDRVFSQALVGKDGWLEFTGSGNLDGYQNATEISPEILESMQQRIQKLSKELRKRNITLVVVIAPNKATMYPDKLPDQIQKLKPLSNLDRFAAYLQQHGPPVLVDLRPALWEGRKQRDIYYKTDTHWNAYGAFIAYTEIMKELSKTHPHLTPKSIEDFKTTNIKSSLRDIPRIIGAANLLEPNFRLTPKKKNNAPKDNLPVLLMYVDSFGMGLRPYIFPHFSKSTMIPIYSENSNMISLKKIDAIKPDIVIVEIVERSFNINILDTFLKQMLSPKN